MGEVFLFGFSQMTIVDFGSTLQTWMSMDREFCTMTSYGLDCRNSIPGKGRDISL
jgi:hypothetical protein